MTRRTRETFTAAGLAALPISRSISPLSLSSALILILAGLLDGDVRHRDVRGGGLCRALDAAFDLAAKIGREMLERPFDPAFGVGRSAPPPTHHPNNPKTQDNTHHLHGSAMANARRHMRNSCSSMTRPRPTAPNPPNFTPRFRRYRRNREVRFYPAPNHAPTRRLMRQASRRCLPKTSAPPSTGSTQP
jgi:hypothetical protein